MSEDFYLIESMLPLIRDVETALKKNLLDASKEVDNYDADTLKKIANIIINLINLSKILKQKRKDARLVSFIKQTEGLSEFLQAIIKAYSGDEKFKTWLKKFNGKKITLQIDQSLQTLILRLKELENTIQEKYKDIKEGNEHTEDIPLHQKGGMFYIKIKELFPGETLKFIHPINQLQMQNQRMRGTKALITYDSKDPISGRRAFRTKDYGPGPASKILITKGHHRVHEIISRYLSGELNGDTLLEIKEDLTTKVAGEN